MSSTRYPLPNHDQELPLPAKLSGTSHNDANNGRTPNAINASRSPEQLNHRATYPINFAAPYHPAMNNAVNNGAGAYAFTAPNFPGFIPTYPSVHGPRAAPTLHHLDNHVDHYQGLNDSHGYHSNGLGRGAAEQGARIFLPPAYQTNPYDPNNGNLTNPYTPPVPYPVTLIPSSQKISPTTRHDTSNVPNAAGTNVTVMPSSSATRRVAPPQSSAPHISSASPTASDAPAKGQSNAPNATRQTNLTVVPPSSTTPRVSVPHSSSSAANTPVSTSSVVVGKPKRNRKPRKVTLTPAPPAQPTYKQVFDFKHPDCIETRLRGGPRKGKSASGGSAETSSSSNNNKRKRNEQVDEEEQERDLHRPPPPPPQAKGKGKAREVITAPSTVPSHPIVSSAASTTGERYDYASAGSSSYAPPLSQAWGPSDPYPAPSFPLDYLPYPFHFNSNYNYGVLPNAEDPTILNSNERVLESSANNDNNDISRLDPDDDGAEIVSKLLSREASQNSLRGLARRESLTDLND